MLVCFSIGFELSNWYTEYVLNLEQALEEKSYSVEINKALWNEWTMLCWNTALQSQLQVEIFLYPER